MKKKLGGINVPYPTPTVLVGGRSGRRLLERRQGAKTKKESVNGSTDILSLDEKCQQR